MKVMHLPSLYLNGICIYSSMIPSKEQLLKQIKESVKE